MLTDEPKEVNMKVLIIGLGSMGKRRARLLRSLMPEAILFGVDSTPSRCDEALLLGFASVYTDLTTAISAARPSAAFVCTAPLAHQTVIRQCLDNGLHVFTELNLVSDGYSELVRLAKERDVVLFLSSTLLYRRDLQYIIQNVHGQKVDYIYHVGQYLPDWHPWENFKDFFVGDRRTNGCREIFAIDLPWLLRAMGDVTDFHVMRDRISDLEIDYPDNFMVSLQHASGSKGLLCVDVISRKAVRRLEVFSEKLQISWNGTPDSLTAWNRSTGEHESVPTYNQVEQNCHYSANIIENAYLAEIETFFAVIQGKDVPLYGFEDDVNTLHLIDRIEGLS